MVDVVTVAVSTMFLAGKLRHLREGGHEVHLVSSPGPALERTAAQDGVAAHPIAMEREISPARDALALLRLWQLTRRLRPDLVNVGTPKAGLLGGLAARLAGVPARVYTLHGLRLETTRGAKRAVLTVTERIAAGCAHRVVCVSPSLRDRAVSLGLTSARKAVVIGAGSSHGVEVAKMNSAGVLERAERLRSRLGISPGAAVVGFVGRFTRDKGIAELVWAHRELRVSFPDLILLLLGDHEAGDPLPAEIRAALESLPGIVRAGFVEDVAPYYHLMTVLALPTYREGFPNAPLEAAAAGKPVVTTNATGARDSVVDGVTGFVVPVGDPRALAAALRRLLESPKLARRMGKAGRERAARDFQPERLWTELEALYRELLAERLAVRERRFEAAKRGLDLVVAGLGLALAAPAMAAVAAAIKLEDGGPVLYVQERVGRGGERFPALKFRSMVLGAERKGLGLAVARNDARITRVGRFIRATSLDELPQLLNVLRGEMSVVGPRPTVPSQVERYDGFQRRRLEVKPGLTGWAQVNGRNAIPWERRIELDVWYVDRRSLLLDLLIMLRTPRALVPRPDTHYGAGGVVEDFRGRGS